MPREDTIIIHHSVTSGTVPSGLSLGEIAANTVDQKFYVGVSGSTAALLSPFTSGNSISSTRYTNSNSSISVPSGAVLLEIVGCGGGGGGAGGAVRLSGNAAGAGGGGQGGQGERVVLRLEDAGITAGVSTIGVTVGAGGLGGASRNVSGNLTGNPGTDGGDTIVYRVSDGGIIVEFPGGEGGVSPNATTTTIVRRAFTHSFLGKINGLGGQGARATTPATGAGNSKWGGGGGGGGAASTVTGTARAAGGTGGSTNYWITFPHPTTNVNGGIPGLSGAAVYNGGNGSTSAYGGGGGGGGWGGRVDTADATEATYYGFTAGRGGEGGSGGGGGGGGGNMIVINAGAGVTANYASGPGGTGGNGYVILTWW